MELGKPEIPRVSLRVKFAVLFVVIVVVLLVANTLWSSYVQRQQAEREMLENAQILALEMNAIWDFMEINQEQFVKDEEGNYCLYCVVAAKAVSKMFTRSSDYTIHYTNTTTRKRDDAPDAFEADALQALKSDEGRESYYALTEYEDGSMVFRYIEPLYIRESCLECHGEPVGELDAMGYPKEGQQLGDIAGAASIIMPADTYLENVRSNIVQEVIIFSIVVIGGLSVIFWCVSRLVTRPLKRMELAAQQMERRDFEKIDFQGIGDRDEIADLAGHLESTSKQLSHLYQDLESEVEQRTVQLEKANKQLQDDNRYKSDFLAVMSHELRTPLTSILAFSDIWEERFFPRDETEHKVIREVRVNAHVLLDLTNNILDMARLEAGKTELELEPVELVDLVHAVEGATSSLAEKKRMTITTSVGRNVPIITADGAKLRRVLENLLSNAIKYTEEGGRVDVAVEHEDGSGEVVLRVSDNGVGIAEQDIPFIFDSFTQGTSGPIPSNGSGLGLAVVRELVGLHGGRVEVVSEVGVGSVFSVYVPIGDGNKEELQ